MRHRLIPWSYILLIIFCVLLLTGCKNPIKGKVEIDKMRFVQVVGVDLADNKDNVRLTLYSKVLQSTGGAKPTGEKKSHIASSEGKTLFDAVRNFHAHETTHIFWGHTTYILMGEDAAKEDILKHLDYFIRSHEERLNSYVVIVKDNTAKDFIEVVNTREQYLHEILKSLFSNKGSLSISSDVKLYHSMAMFDSEYSSAYLPYITLTDKDFKEEEEIKDKLEVELSGFAVFKKEKLLDFLDRETSRGLNWITGNISTGIILVKDEKEKDISLEIIESNSKIKPEFKDGKPAVTIEISVSCNVGEQQSTENIYTRKNLEKLEKQLSEAVIKEANTALKYAQEKKVDFLGIGNAIYHKFPLKWEPLKKDWDTIFPGTKITIEVKSKINRSFEMNVPVRGKVK